MGDLPHHPLLSWDVGRSSSQSVPAIPGILDAQQRVFTRSARSAFALALQIAEIGAGARVLVPNYYCPTMPAPVAAVGAIPMFYPITRESLPDLDWLRANTLPDCKALLVAHFFGAPASLAAVREFCDQSALLMIEDCAHTFFGSVSGASVGSFGHYAIASLPKFFAVREGGILASCSRDLSRVRIPSRPFASELQAVWNMMEAAAQHGRITGFNSMVNLGAFLLQSARGSGRGDAVMGETLTTRSPEAVRSDSLADPLLIPARLRRVEEYLLNHTSQSQIAMQRLRNYRRLAEVLPDQDGLTALFPQIAERTAPYVFPVRVSAPDEVYARLRARRLPVLRWDRYWPGAIESRGDIGRDWGHHVLQILCHQDLTVDDVTRIARHLIDAVNQVGQRAAL